MSHASCSPNFHSIPDCSLCPVHSIQNKGVIPLTKKMQFGENAPHNEVFIGERCSCCSRKKPQTILLTKSDRNGWVKLPATENLGPNEKGELVSKRILEGTIILCPNCRRETLEEYQEIEKGTYDNPTETLKRIKRRQEPVDRIGGSLSVEPPSEHVEPPIPSRWNRFINWILHRSV